MAPAAAATKALQQNRPRPRSVVPVIPLLYVQKRQQQEAARAKAREEAIVPTPTPAPVVELPRSPTPPSSDSSPTAANASSDDQISEKIEAVVEPTPLSSATIPDVSLEEEHNAAPEESEVFVQEKMSEGVQEIPTPKSIPSEGRSSTSRSTYHMPPPFVPATNNQPNGNNTAPPINATNGHYSLHHPHPSVANVMFGGFPDSARSSPAPPPLNPQQYPQMAPATDGGYRPRFPPNGHAQSMSIGYPVNGTPAAPPGFFPREDGHAGFRQPPYAGPDGYSSSTTAMGDQLRMSQDPLSPHSFHGSQSSIVNEQEAAGPAFCSQYPTAVISNGSNGHIEDVRLLHNTRPNYIPPPAHPFGSYLPDELDGWHMYLQTQFSRPEYANYIFELRYLDDRAPPLRIPGHGILFAQSGVLRALMLACDGRDGHDGQAVPTLLVESDDRFLRSDSMWLLLQRLYGAPLIEHGPSRAYPSSPFQNPPADPFGFALGYAAAAKLLAMRTASDRGMEVAAQLLNWDNIERALDFATDGGLAPNWSLGFSSPNFPDNVPTYGPGANILLHHIMRFIIASFPAGFVLDNSVEDLTILRRLPVISQAGQNSRLSSIKFGDHASEEYVRSTPENSITASLSRLLISLPYDLLRYVLESPNLGNVQGWATTGLRHKVMSAVVEEREKRRIKALESPHVSNEERKSNGKDWEVVGWMEKVEQVSKLPSKDPVPAITRSWVDFTLLDQD